MQMASVTVMTHWANQTVPSVCNNLLIGEMGSLTGMLDREPGHDIMHINYFANIWVNNNPFFPIPLWMDGW